eukprot:CAMPEP_0172561286 /NCGR_PEP_ID=MMETSP1067-20121228/92261_1 /TAXON_ID=265564 ORGANISM="Thalassiosira punctigera, Strain Tpunct2005C2" /NCGR_SAMPLE_ID=MMETSP1067 /ASSEMBLY_ACC=CAM_ASM_000444 /LENGTH=84 /DNA_ID=CAMNT_0013351297 /DNA_START=103 /DNA_END=354 /DNA_ORIENTATION=-
MSASSLALSTAFLRSSSSRSLRLQTCSAYEASRWLEHRLSSSNASCAASVFAFASTNSALSRLELRLSSSKDFRDASTSAFASA